jgi:hypothetical protein
VNDGYARIDGLLDARAVAALRRAVEVALAAPPVPGCEREHNRLAPLRWDDAIVDLVLRDRGRCRAIAAATGGDDLRWISGYVTVKDPGTQALDWHRDWWCWDHPVSRRPAAAQIAVIVYLTATDERSGALRAVPGSHLGHGAAHEVTLPARPGDAVVLDYRLLHGTHPNAAATRRDAVLLSFAPSWRALPADVRGHLIQHLALPGDGEPVPRGGWHQRLLPSFDGERLDLPLNLVAPH